MIVNRVFAPPSKATFTIKPIKELLARYVGEGKGWADPFSGWSELAEFRNDLNPESPAQYHILAADFAKQISRTNVLEGVLCDPPYSPRQVKEHYKAFKINPTVLDTSSNFEFRVINEIYGAIRLEGLAICFGWDGNGFGKVRGFEMIETLLVCHGARHHATIVTVEKRVEEVKYPVKDVEDVDHNDPENPAA